MIRTWTDTPILSDHSEYRGPELKRGHDSELAFFPPFPCNELLGFFAAFFVLLACVNLTFTGVDEAAGTTRGEGSDAGFDTGTGSGPADLGITAPPVQGFLGSRLGTVILIESWSEK